MVDPEFEWLGTIAMKQGRKERKKEEDGRKERKKENDFYELSTAVPWLEMLHDPNSG